MTDALVHTVGVMGTVVTFHVVGHGSNDTERRERAHGVDRAVEWFTRVEHACSRFEPDSEISKLIRSAHRPMAVSPVLYEAVHFALAVAEESDGAFDPTVGSTLEARGFDTSYRTGNAARTAVDAKATFRDIVLNDNEKTITLLRPLVLDLGAVAKGLAIDLAARELERFGDFAIDAGGDLFFAGHNARGDEWSVGIRHPRDASQIIETLRVSNAAVCTSGDYEREHHIVDARTHERTPASDVASVTVIAPSAMVADALGTAAFALGPARGIELLKRHGVEGFVFTPALERLST